jgi:hypothetical protein
VRWRRRPAGVSAAAVAVIAFACGGAGAGIEAAAGTARAGPAVPTGAAGAILFRSTRVLDGLPGLHAMDAGGAALRALALGVGSAAHWSPDGRRIAFSRPEGDDWYDLYVVQAGGSGLRRIVRDRTDRGVFPAGQLTWAPDGRRVAFTVPGEAGGAGSAIAVVGADGRGRRRLTRPGAASDSRPTWSPDGRWIAFVRDAGGCGRPNGVCGRLFLVSSDGRRLRRLPTGSTDGVIGRPSWSPDGRRLAFALCCDGGAHVVNVDGTGRHPIVRQATVYVSWSPNGRWIALVGDGTHVVRPNGSGYRRISAHGTGTASWSPDSRAVAIEDRCCEPDVWVVAVDGSGERRLTEGWRFGYGNHGPEWNPRGRPAARLGGTWVSPANPTDSRVEGGVLRATQTIARLSADASRVAVAYANGKVETWEAPNGPITRFRLVYHTGTPSPGFGSRGFAMAGERVAMTRYSSGLGIDSWTVSSATLEVPRAVDLIAGSARWPDLCCSTPLEHLEGDGPLLVVDSWGPCRISQSPPCSRSPKFGGRLHRVEVDRVTQIASDRGPLSLLSVDGDRILVDRENGALQLFRADGTQLFAITHAPARLLAAHLEGNDVAVLTTEGLSAYDARTGDLRRHRRLAASDARLVDVANGIAVYLAGDEIHLHRLDDGHESVIRPDGRGPVLAELEETGLFYSYAVADETFPGRVAFLPFASLPPR